MKTFTTEFELDDVFFVIIKTSFFLVLRYLARTLTLAFNIKKVYQYTGKKLAERINLKNNTNFIFQMAKKTTKGFYVKTTRYNLELQYLK